MASVEGANILSTAEERGVDTSRLACNGHTVQVRVNRPVYTRQDFNQKYIVEGVPSNAAAVATDRQSSTFLGGLQHRLRSLCPSPSGDCVKKTALSFLPFINIMREYSVRNDLLNDVMSGLIVGIMHIPQGE